MTFEELLTLVCAEPDDPPGAARYVITSASVTNADELLADDSIEILTLSREFDPDEVPGRSQLMGLDNVVDVLETWSKWRDGRLPSPREAATAIMWFVDHDAYVPVDQT